MFLVTLQTIHIENVVGKALDSCSRGGNFTITPMLEVYHERDVSNCQS